VRPRHTVTPCARTSWFAVSLIFWRAAERRAGGCDTADSSQLGTFITTDACGTASGGCGAGDVIAPPASRINHDNLWYLPYDDASGVRNWAGATELVYSADPEHPDHPQAAWAAGGYKLWYGEDLRDQSVGDNGGVACVDVYYQQGSDGGNQCGPEALAECGVPPQRFRYTRST
jgi:hypothetical protein